MTNDLSVWQDILTPDQIAAIERIAGQPPAQAIRLNTLKIDRETALRTWPELYGWQLEPVPFCPDGLFFRTRPAALGRALEHRMGFFYIQDMASMLPAELFTLPANTSNFPLSTFHFPLVLDMAAAPGGKTTHLACRTGDRGLIVANDISGSRAGAMLSNLRRWGMTSAAVTNLPGERLGRWLPETFDAVLLDAPCSGENLRNEGGSKQRRVSARERRALHDRQVRLLLSAFGAAKPGGEVVYATCTVAPDEDEAVLDDFVNEAGSAAEIVRPDHLSSLPSGLATASGRTFDPQVGNAIRLWPYLFDTGSFFAALIRKRDSLPDRREDRMPGSGPRRGNFSPLPAGDRARVAAILRANYGFDLDALLDDYSLDAWSAGRFVHAIPRLLETHFEGLPVKAAGMLVGDMGEEGFIPSHELVSRFFERFIRGRLRLPDEAIPAWLSGKEIAAVVPPDQPQGRVALLEDGLGRFLGRGRVLGGRIKPMLPAGF